MRDAIDEQKQIHKPDSVLWEDSRYKHHSYYRCTKQYKRPYYYLFPAVNINQVREEDQENDVANLHAGSEEHVSYFWCTVNIEFSHHIGKGKGTVPIHSSRNIWLHSILIIVTEVFRSTRKRCFSCVCKCAIEVWFHF